MDSSRENILTLDLTAFILSSTFGDTSLAPNFVATRRKHLGAEHHLSKPDHLCEKLGVCLSTASARIVRPERWLLGGGVVLCLLCQGIARSGRTNFKGDSFRQAHGHAAHGLSKDIQGPSPMSASYT